jgi:hypothetical protein
LLKIKGKRKHNPEEEFNDKFKEESESFLDGKYALSTNLGFSANILAISISFDFT